MPEFSKPIISDQLAVRLGQVLVRWTAVEQLICLLLGTLMGAHLGSMEVLANGVSASAQAKWIRSLMAAHEHETMHNVRVIELLTRLDDLRQERNELVHGRWDSTNCDADTCMIMTVNLDRAEMIKDRLITVRDLDDLISDIDDWIDSYVALGRELGFPRQRGESKSIFVEEEGPPLS